MNVLGAMTAGYSIKQVLNYLSEAFPELGHRIQEAMRAGKRPEDIMKYVSNLDRSKLSKIKGATKGVMPFPDDGMMNPYIRSRQAIKQHDPIPQGVKTGAKLGAAALGGYALSQALPQALQAARSAMPQILPGQPKPPSPGPSPTSNQIAAQVAQNSPQLAANPTLQQAAQNVGSVPQEQPVAQPQEQIPQQPPKAEPQQEFAPGLERIPEIAAVQKERGKISQLYELAKRPGTPKGVQLDTNDKNFVKYAKTLMKSGDIPNEQTLGHFYRWWNGTPQSKRGNARTEFELFRNQTPWLRNIAESGVKDEIAPNSESIAPEVAEKQEIGQKVADTTQPKTSKAAIGKLAALPNGDIGSIESIKNNIAKVNVNGKQKQYKTSDLQHEPEDLEDIVREMVQAIPENKRSRALQSMVHIPGLNIMLTKFYDGKVAYYMDVDPELYGKIASGSYKPKTAKRTTMGEHNPEIVDSRGAGFSSEIVRNPKYGKDQKGKTWGYATSEYDALSHIQHLLKKFTNEEIDEEGNIIQRKPKQKKD